MKIAAAGKKMQKKDVKFTSSTIMVLGGMLVGAADLASAVAVVGGKIILRVYYKLLFLDKRRRRPARYLIL